MRLDEGNILLERLKSVTFSPVGLSRVEGSGFDGSTFPAFDICRGRSHFGSTFSVLLVVGSIDGIDLGVSPVLDNGSNPSSCTCR